MSVSRETLLIDMFYSPSQPRGDDGRWTDGGGGSGSTLAARLGGNDREASEAAKREFSAGLTEVAQRTLGKDFDIDAGANNKYFDTYLRLKAKVDPSTHKADGLVQRNIYTSEGRVIVKHEMFTLNRKLTGQGLGSEFTKASEDYYRSIGVDEIRLEANIDVGGYAWARAGYDFADTKGVAGILRSIKAAGNPELTAQKAELSRRLKSGDESQRPTAFEVSQLGRTEGATTWPGKEAMLGSKWQGRKILTPAKAALAETMFYDPGQPRAADGRWTDGGGSYSSAQLDAHASGYTVTGPGPGEAFTRRIAAEDLRLRKLYPHVNPRVSLIPHVEGEPLGETLLYNTGTIDLTVAYGDLPTTAPEGHFVAYDRTFVHEFGHAHAYSTNTAAERIDLVASTVVEHAGVERTGPAVSGALREGISAYAGTNPEEAIAEAFTDVHVNGSGASTLSKALMSKMGVGADMFYDPGQPRAADGKWTDGAGGGAAKASARMAGWQKFRETEAAGDQELDAITKYMAAEITDTEKSTIEWMKSDSGADSVGYYLRSLKGTPDEEKWLGKDKSMAKAKAAVEVMDGLMADIPAITEPITMYRGYRNWQDYLPEAAALTGTELVDKGFMFTSADKGVAQYYADEASDKTLMVQFEVPAGSKVLPFWGIHESYVDDFTGDYTSKEAYAEILLPRDVTLNVKSVTNGWKGYTAHADYTP